MLNAVWKRGAKLCGLAKLSALWNFFVDGVDFLSIKTLYAGRGVLSNCERKILFALMFGPWNGPLITVHSH